MTKADEPRLTLEQIAMDRRDAIEAKKLQLEKNSTC